MHWEKFWHYLSTGTHPISVLTISASFGALAISFINTRRGHFDLMVKKYDLVTPVYEKTINRIDSCYVAYLNVVNLTRQQFVQALDIRNMAQSIGEYQLRQYAHSERQFEIQIDQKLPDAAQILISKINHLFERGMHLLSESVHDYQSGVITEKIFLSKNKIWEQNGKELADQIGKLKSYSVSDLEQLTKGIRKR